MKKDNARLYESGAYPLLTEALREEGFNLPSVPLTAEEMADELSLLPLKASLR